MISFFFFCFFKQKTAYEMRISDWSSDVCSSDLNPTAKNRQADPALNRRSGSHRDRQGRAGRHIARFGLSAQFAGALAPSRASLSGHRLARADGVTADRGPRLVLRIAPRSPCQAARRNKKPRKGGGSAAPVAENGSDGAADRRRGARFKQSAYGDRKSTR